MFTSTARVCAVHPMTSHQIIHSKSLYCRVGLLELHQLGPQSTPRLHRLDSCLKQEPYGWVSLFLHLPGEGLILTKVCLPHSLARSFTLPSLPSLSLSYLFHLLLCQFVAQQIESSGCTGARLNICQVESQKRFLNRCQIEWQHICQIECHTDCQNIWQIIWQIECQLQCQMERQNIWVADKITYYTAMVMAKVGGPLSVVKAFYFHTMCKNKVSVSGWSPIGCECFSRNLNIPCPLPTTLVFR